MFNKFLVPILILLLTFVVGIPAYSLKVLVLGGITEPPNFDLQALQKFPEVAGETIEYTETKDRTLSDPQLDVESFDVLWIGQGEICENQYLLNKETEDKIKKFVEDGGIVVTANQDSDGGRPCESGWLSKPLVGVETSDHGFTPTPEAGDLFSVPNQINPDSLNMDDSWAQPHEDFIVLAESGGNTPFVMLLHGKGMYLVTDMETHEAGEVETNAPMHENILYFVIKWREENLFSVAPGGKLPLMWGTIKTKL